MTCSFGNYEFVRALSIVYLAFQLTVHSHLKDDHLNQFILAAENSCSLVYLDTSNNDGLNSTLVKRLKEVLEFNALKHPYVIQPISTSVSDRMVSNRRGQNIGHLHSFLKEMKLNTKILNLPIETRHEMTKNKYVCYSQNF